MKPAGQSGWGWMAGAGAGILRLVLALAVVYGGVGGPVASGQAASGPEWTAQWISHPTAPLREAITLHFRRDFSLTAVPSHFVVHVSADNRFVLFVNGERVGGGPARGDLAHWRYETFDLAPMLRAGSNTLGATVWNAGIYAPVAQFTDRTAFLVQGDTRAESVVNSGEDWWVEVEPGQMPTPREKNGNWAYMASGTGEMLRAAEYDWTWMTEPVEQAGGHWVHAGPALRENIYPHAGTAALRGTTADVPWELVPDALPAMAYTPEGAGHVVRGDVAGAQSFPEHGVTIAAHEKTHLLLDRGELTTGYPRLEFSGGKGAHIVMTYAEALYDAQMHKGNRNEVGTRQAVGLSDSILADGGEQRSFEPMWWRTWRYLDISVETGDEPLTLDGLKAYFSAYPFDERASFESSDPDLEKIWSIGWHTAQLDAHETYMDTPYYEQLQYAGDTRIQALISYAVTGDDRLARQAIEALDDSRIPAGITASRYPSALPQYIPPFSLLWIGMIHDYYEYRPDRAFVRSKLPGERTVLDWFAGYQQADGLLAKTPWWSFIDWVETETKEPFPSYDAKGESCLTTMEYIGALEDAIDLEGTLGRADEAALDRDRLTRAKHGEMAQCWDAGRKLFADTSAKTMFSQHTNALGVLYDVAPKSEQAALMHRIDGGEIGAPAGESAPTVQIIGASYYFRFYLARALEHAGLADEYLKTLGNWHGFLSMGFTTWPEEPGNTRSDSHAWSAHPTYDLLTLVAGVEPGKAGFGTVRIAPHLGDLTHVEASYPHALGLIHVVYDKKGETVAARITLPPGLTGTLAWNGRTTALHSGENTLALPLQ